MMTKTFWISLGAATAVSAVVLASQRGTVVGLRKQVTEIRGEVEEMEMPGWRPAPRGRTSLPEGVNHPAAERKARTPEALPADSKTKIRSAKRRLETLFSDIGDMRESPAEFMKILPEVLEAIQDLNVEEMLALSKEFGDLNNPQDTGNFAKMILIMLAAEYDPHRVLDDKTLIGEGGPANEFRMAALGALARKDAGAAKRWFKNADLEDFERRQLAMGISVRLLQRDLAEGIAFLKELTPHEREQALMSIGMMLDDAGTREQLFDLVLEEQDKELREQLGVGLISMTLVKGSVEEAKGMLDDLGFDRDTRIEIISSISYEAMGFAPEQMISWLMEETEGTERADAIGNMVRNWAYSDFNAAGEWLGKQKPSPMKNTAISQFAQTVVKVDPAAALAWVDEITDEKMQKSARRNVLSTWAAKDRAAVNAWLAENGMSQEEWLGPRPRSAEIGLETAATVHPIRIVDDEKGELTLTPEEWEAYKKEHGITDEGLSTNRTE